MNLFKVVFAIFFITILTAEGYTDEEMKEINEF